MTSTGQGLLGNNMFAYCNNNPVMLKDQSGTDPDYSLDTNGDGEDDCYVYSYTYTTSFLWWSETRTGYVYMYVGYTSGSQLNGQDAPDGFNPSSDLMAAYYVTTDPKGNANPVIYAYHANEVKETHRSSIIDCFQKFDEDFSTPWDRTDDSLLTEWEGHYKYRIVESARNIDFDNYEEGKPLDYYDQKAYDRLKDLIQGILNLS